METRVIDMAKQKYPSFHRPTQHSMTCRTILVHQKLQNQCLNHSLSSHTMIRSSCHTNWDLKTRLSNKNHPTKPDTVTTSYS